jgi:hypothetical protein
MQSFRSIGEKNSFLFFSDFVQHDVRRPLIAQKDVRRSYFDLQTHRVHQSVLFWRFVFQSSKKLVFLGLFRVQIPKKSIIVLGRQILF